MKPLLPSLEDMARLLGGEIVKDGVSCPGPGHSQDDRSLSVKPSRDAECGFVLNSFAGDDIQVCKDHVRQKLKLPEFEPAKPTKKKKNDKAYSQTVASYVYRTADGEPYLRVDRTATKQFFQYHWDGGMWKPGAPKGEKIPYRLPELIAAPITTPVHVVEGESKAVLLAKLGFTVTSSSGGAGKWTADLNKWFEGRIVYIHPDNDKPGHDHGQLVARNVDPVAKSVRVVPLAGLPPKGDIKQWLEHDPSGARLIKECERAPLWEPAAEKPRTAEADEALVSELAALSTLAYAKRRKEAAEEIGIAVGFLDKAVAEARGEAKPVEDEGEWGGRAVARRGADRRTARRSLPDLQAISHRARTRRGDDGAVAIARLGFGCVRHQPVPVLPKPVASLRQDQRDAADLPDRTAHRAHVEHQPSGHFQIRRYASPDARH